MREGLVLVEVARRLERAAGVWAVFAGAAASVYGAQRPLTDVDILVPLAAGTRVASLFPGAVVEREADGRVGSVKLPTGSISLPTGSISLPAVDIIVGLTMFEGDETYTVDLDDEMAVRRTWHEIAGVRMPVIPAEDNLLLKAVWGRGAEQGKHDWEDVRAMLAHTEVDWAYLRGRAASWGAVPGEPAPSVRRALARLEELAKEQEG